MTPPESLTEEERRELEVYVSVTGPSSIRGVEDEVAKLLRIHDRLQGEVRELKERPPMVHLDRVPSLEDRKALRDMLMPDTALASIRAELDRAEQRFRNREHGGVILGDFYDAAKAVLKPPI
jgi:hypothetical protein